MGAKRFEALDGLRGIAAIAIVIRHTPALFGYPASYYATAAYPPESFLAVDFFFILSGFVLAHAYGARLSERKLTPAGFAIVRLRRFYPLHIAGLVLGAAGFYFLHIDGLALMIFAVFGLLFVPMSGPTMFPLNGPVWSLHFELLINLIYGVIAPWLENWVLAGIVIFASLVLSFSVWHGWLGITNSLGPMAGGFALSSYWAGIVRVTFSFFAGVLVHRQYLSMPKIKVPIFIPAGALIIALFAQPSNHLRPLFELLMVIVAFPGIVLMGAYSSPKKITAAICSALGAASYAIYVLHVPVYRLLFEVEVHRIYQWPVGMLFLGAMVALAIAADRFYDIPLRRFFISDAAKSLLP